MITEALQRTEIVRVESLTRVFGPYWTDSAALTTVGSYVVVLGGGDTVVCTVADRMARLVTFGPRDFKHLLVTKFGLEDR